jgi:hypothetical protein
MRSFFLLLLLAAAALATTSSSAAVDDTWHLARLTSLGAYAFAVLCLCCRGGGGGAHSGRRPLRRSRDLTPF